MSCFFKLPRCFISSSLVWGGVVAVLLTGCGYHLRGYQTELAPVHVFVSGDGGDSALRARLERTIAQQGGKMESAPQAGVPHLELARATLAREVLSVADSGKVSAYRLVFRLQYRLLSNGDRTSQEANGSVGSDAASLRSLRVTRDFRFSTAQALSASDEERRLGEEMRQEAVDRLLRVLAK